MAEQLILTDPVVIPEQVTDTYRVIAVSFMTEVVGPPMPGVIPGFLSVTVADNLNVTTMYSYTGPEAIDMVKWLNTGNFTVKSMHKTILERLSADGKLPGTVTGTPDPPTSPTF